MDTRLAGSIGERLGAGIQQGVQAFMAGVEQKRMKDEKKQQDEAALQFAIKAAPMLGLDPADHESLKAGIKGMGGGSQFLKFAQEAQYMKAQTDRMQAAEKSRMAAVKAFEETADGLWGATDTGAGGGELDFENFDIKKFAIKAKRYGADEEDIAGFANIVEDRKAEAPNFFTDPNTGATVSVLGKSQVLLGKPGDDKEPKKGDTVHFKPLGKDIIWNGSATNSLDAETGEPLYVVEVDPVTTARKYVKNPLVWGPAAGDGGVEIPDNLFGNVNF
jgi:hypothetical protein